MSDITKIVTTMLIIGMVVLQSLSVKAQITDHRAWADSVYGSLESGLSINAGEAVTLSDSLYSLYSLWGDTCRAVKCIIIQGSQYERLGDLEKALQLLQYAKDLVPIECSADLNASICLNQTSIYLSMNDFARVDSVAAQGLKASHGDFQLMRTRGHIMINQAIGRAYSGDHLGAASIFNLLYKEGIENNLMDNAAYALQNIGTIHAIAGRADSAASAYEQCLVLLKSLDDKDAQISVLSNLAGIEDMRGNLSLGLEYLDSALVLSESLGIVEQQSVIMQNRANILHKMGNHDKSWSAFQRYLVLRDSVLSEEQIHALADVREKYETEKKAKENIRLTAENLEAELDKSKAQRARNIYLFSGIGILFLAGGLWSRLRYVNRSRLAIQAEKDVSEGLLLNILPEETAKELKEKGNAEAKLIDMVTVLFTDFKGFTAMAEQMSPEDLVNDLHTCFSEFDLIMEKYGIEKIKTIGDAYMAAGGLPTPNDTHAHDVIKAAMEMRDFVATGKARKIEAGLPFFEIRIGVHSGPVVAGIVGVKKFQYDIWGDTVNTASRMESSGEVGQVNISEATYELVKGNSAFDFTYRGKIEAKGKGEMKMYFARLT